MSVCDEYINEIPDKGSDAVERGKQIANGLVKLVGLNLMQACAFVGYCMKESSCDPKAYNKAEASGALAGRSTALGADCGEGIMQWSFVNTKNKARAVIGLPPSNNYPGDIMNLSMEQQIEMMAKGSFVTNAVQQGMKSANNWDSAVCCACIQGHGSGRAQECHQLVGGNINDPKYIEAVRQQWPPGGPYTARCARASGDQKALSKAKKWAMQVYTAMGGVAGDFNGTGSGGGTHQWPDFNLKEFPIMQDEKGRYTEEPIGWGIANHLQIEGGSTGGELGGGDTFGGGNFSIDGGKFTGTVNVTIQNPQAYNLVLYRYEFGTGSGGHRAVDGVIFEYDSKNILCYTIEDDFDVSNCGLKAKTTPHEIVAGGAGWCNADAYHRGQSKCTLACANGRGPWAGKSVGSPGTMLTHKVGSRTTGCLFHAGMDVNWSTGCTLIGHKATNGRRSFDKSQYLEANILTSSDQAVQYHRNFYSHVVEQICNGKTVHLHVTGVW